MIKGLFERIPGIHRFRHLSDAWNCAFAPAPDFVSNGWQWRLRRLVSPVLSLPIVIRHRNGELYRLSRDPIDDIVFRELFSTYWKLFFPQELPRQSENLLILDVGAHRGFYTVAAAMRFPSAEIIAVEPDPRISAGLRKNVALNDLTRRVEVCEGAIAATDGFAELEQSQEGSWGNRVLRQPTPGARTSTVRSFKLSSVLKGRQPDIVKSNCEGGEFYLIPQLFELGMKPRVIILLLHPDEGNVTHLLGQIETSGYTVTPIESSASHPRYVCVREQS